MQNSSAEKNRNVFDYETFLSLRFQKAVFAGVGEHSDSATENEGCMISILMMSNTVLNVLYSWIMIANVQELSAVHWD